MAKRRKGRQIDGILLLDKPYEMSSNSALQVCKRLFFANKAGHTGALDPMATGMLPICFGEGTKFSQFLLDTDKTYIVTAKLGIRTTTSDAEGEVVSEKPVNITEAELLPALDSFRGDSKQVPSMYSALKYQGQPLYKYAREGITIEREARDITVFNLELQRFEGDEVDLEIHVSKGTYIRTIIDDLGELLGCGAHVSMLRRTKVGPYPVAKMVTLDHLKSLVEDAKAKGEEPYDVLDSLLVPMDTAVFELTEINVDADSARFLRLGNPVSASGLPATGTLVKVTLGDEKEFIGVAHINDDGMLAPKRIVVDHSLNS
ncbi:tRNA pseudouridine(55) synthase TruB [Thalassomonas sp. M1454]|uniref:tRNA pseudouridine(55) synthase TruB n=1 Tax=Thalassomonas sp. M1454 TaxID=2594477 RepID=UPI00117FACF8|nr:tRNA pseudouridine(55) synthase TruB [Thalassomonas sp. M1454]TRX56542.1 tRNA pseudouridine(55) synthase TruB [Thalassomonas sp. M1454]